MAPPRPKRNLRFLDQWDCSSETRGDFESPRHMALPAKAGCETSRPPQAQGFSLMGLSLFWLAASLAGLGATDQLQVGGALEEAGVGVPLHQAVDLGLGQVEAPGARLLQALPGQRLGHVVEVHLREERSTWLL